MKTLYDTSIVTLTVLPVTNFMAEDIIKKVTESPALVLDKTVDASKQIFESVYNNESIKKAGQYWKTLGPGLTTGAADDDPSGIATYSQTGAQYGYQLLWLSAFTLPLMAIVQEMCARIGLATGRGLAGNIRLHYPKWALYLCTIFLFVANTLNIGADLGAMAKATQLLAPKWNFGLLILAFTVVSLAFQIFIPYAKYAHYLKFLALILLAYILSAGMANIDVHKLFANAVIPHIVFNKNQIFLICAILGTTISPYLFFWQTSQEVEEEIKLGKTTIKLRQDASDKEVKNMRIDVWSGMFISNVVMFFIIATCAATLFSHGITNITTAADAAQALKPLAGENAYILFTLGIIGTGMLAIPILAGATSYALSESLQWKLGLHKSLKQAPSFYGVIIISMAIGLVMNFVGIDPIKALIYSAVANGLVAPIILIFIVSLSSSKRVMKERVNHPAVTMIGWITIIAMTIAGLATIYSLI